MPCLSFSRQVAQEASLPAVIRMMQKTQRRLGSKGLSSFEDTLFCVGLKLKELKPPKIGGGGGLPETC